MKLSNFIFIAALLFVLVTATGAQSTRDKGIDLYRAGEFEKSSSALLEATVADKKDSLAWIYLGASLHKQGKGKEAISAFKKGKIRKKEDRTGDEMRAEILERPRPRYTEMGRQNMTSGVVRLAVEFGAEGKIRSIVPIHTLPDGLTEQSIAAAKSIKFLPPMKDGKPLTTVELIEYTFEIR